MYTELYVPAYKYEEMLRKYSDELANYNSIKSIVVYENKEYIVTSSNSIGSGKSWEGLSGYRIDNEHSYKGELKPLLKALHDVEVQLQKRPRSYTGRLIKYGLRKYVVCEPIRFFKTEALTQTFLF